MASVARKGTIGAADEVTLLPGYALHDTTSRNWLLDVRGAVYDPSDVKLRKRMLLNILQRFMKIDSSALESPLFQERIRVFVASTERGKRIVIRIGDQKFPLRKKSKRNGRFESRIRIPEEQFEKLASLGHVKNDQICFDVVVEDDDRNLFPGRIHVLTDTGISVVSDIDDTVKFTNVSSRRELVENTFFRDFRGIDSIPEVFRSWAECGAAFHYVSSSPWQLLKPLEELFAELGMPPGTMDLRSFQLREQMLRRVKLVRRPGKSVPIRNLMKSFPNRDFVLVGDSRERDPEMYAKLANRFRGQVLAIFIREYDDRPMTAERIDRVDQLSGESLCRCFRTSEQLKELGEAIFCKASAG